MEHLRKTFCAGGALKKVSRGFFHGIFLCAILIISLAISFGFSTPVFAAGVPSILSYQGRLTDASSNLLGGNGTNYYFKFSLWDSATVGSGNRVWPTAAPTAVQSIVRHGVFNVNIGDVANGYPDTLNYNFNSSNIFLQVEVSSDGVTYETLSPRQQISSTAFAQVSGAVSGTGQSTFGTLVPHGNSVVSIESTTSSATALSVKGATGQTGDLFSVKDSSSNILFLINSSGGFVTMGSSTLQNFTARNSTTTNATSTTIFASTGHFTNLTADAITTGLIDGCLRSVAGVISSTGTPCGSSGGSGGGTWATSTSQVANQNVNYSLSSTDLVAIGGSATTSAKYWFDPNTQIATLAGLTNLTNVLVTGSTTLQNFTARNSTTTNATTTTLFATTASTTNLFATNLTAGNFTAGNFTTSNLTIGNLNGILQADNGVITATSTTNLKKTLALDNVENTALSTWAGSGALTTLGTVTTGVWHGTPIEDAYITKTGDWSGLFDGLQGTDYLSKSFSTTSADFYANSSTTIPKTYSANVFSNLNTFNGGLTISTLNGPLQANNGVVSATTSVGVNYGGTGLTAAPGNGDILVGNSNGGYTLTATSSLGLPTLGTLGNYLSLASWYGTTTDQLREGTTNLYYTDTRVNSYINGSTTIPKAYTNNTFTGSNTFNGATTLASLLVNGSTTLQNFTGGNSTTTNATSTSIFASLITATNLVASNFNVTNLTAGTVNGQTISAAANFTGTLTATGGLTTLSNLLVTGSSTLQNFTASNSTTTNATSTTLFASVASSTNLFATNITSGLINGQQISSTANFTGTLTATGGLVTILNELHTGSTTLQNFTGVNATTTNATTTTLFATTASTTNLFATNFTVANLTTGLINGQTISSAANFTGTLTATGGLTTLSNLLATGSSTLQNFTASNGTTTNATTTTLFASVASTTNLFATNITSGLINGQQISSTANFTGTLTATGGLVTILNELHIGSTTLQAFTATNSTTTNATTTTLFATTASTTNLFATNFTVANLTTGLVNGQTISSAANFTGTLTATGGLTTLSNLLVTGSSTLQNFTGGNSTTTNATSTTLFATTGKITNLTATSLVLGLSDGCLTITGGSVSSAACGSGSGSAGTWSTTTSQVAGIFVNYPNNSTDVVAIGGTATTSAKYWFDPNAQIASLAGLTNLTNVLVTGSTTLQNFTARNSTTTNATSTTLFASVASTTNLFATTITAGLFNGQQISSTANFTGTLTALGGLTSLSNLLVTGSSTFQNFTASNSTTTNATSTSFFATTASSTNLFATNITSGLINGQQISSSANFTGSVTATGGLVTILNELHTGSTTLQNFTGSNSTTTNATTTTLFATTASTTNLFATNFTVANLTTGLVNGQTISSAANFTGTLNISGLTTINNGFLALASSTLQNFTASNGTTTNATSTTLFASVASTTNLFATNLTAAAITSGLINGQNISSAANFTGTLNATGGLVTILNELHTGSTTLQAFTATNSTTTNATSTTLFATTGKITNLTATSLVLGLSDGCLTVTGGSVGSAACGSGSGAGTWSTTTSQVAGVFVNYPNNSTDVVAIGGSATTSAKYWFDPNTQIASLAGLTNLTNVLVTGSTTLQNFTASNGTTTNATTTTLFASVASTTNLFATTITAGLFNGQQISSTANFTGTLTATGGLVTILNELHTGSTTLQNFTGVNSTTTNATTTTLFATTASTTNLFATNFTVANLTTGLINGQTISSAANFTGTLTATGGLTTLSNLLATGSSTFQNFTASNGTTTNATSTTLFASVASTTNLFATNITSGLINGQQISSTANFTGTLTATGGLVTILNELHTGSTTLQNFTGVNSTTTNATTTTLFATTASTTNLFATNFTVANLTSGLINGQTISSAANFTGTLTATGGLTTLSNLLATGSSTFQNFTGVNATTTNATSTTFFASVASTTNLFATNLTAASITSGLINGQTISSAANFTGTLTATGGLTTLSNLLATGSSTLQNFTASNSTTTNATSTTLFASVASTTNLFATNITSGLINGQQISSTANLTGVLTVAGLTTLTNGSLALASTTLQNFTGVNATTTNATTTTLAITGVSNALLKTLPSGAVVAAVLNTDYINSSVTTLSSLTSIGTLGTLNVSGLATLGNILATGSSTFQNFTGANSTTTNATSTTLFASVASTTNLFATNLTAAAITSGLINGQQISSTANFTGTLTATGGLTTLSNLLATGSSTLQNFTASNGTTTNATSTTLFASVASSTNLFATNITSGLINGQQISSTANFTGTLTATGGLVTILNELHTGSTTLQNFTGVNSTTTNATTTTLFATTASTTNLFATNFTVANLTTGLINGQTISSAANFTGTLTATGGLTTLSNLLATGSSTLQNFTASNSTTTNATSTTLFASVASTTNLFATNLTAAAITSGLINGQTISSAANFTGTLTATGGLTTLSNLLATGSSTLQNFTASNGTTTNATSTTLFASVASTTNLFATNVTSGLINGQQISSTANFTGTLTATGGLVTILNELHTGSTTLQNFTGVNSTTTNATTTTLFATTASTTNLFATNFTVANLTTGLINGQTISSAANFTGTLTATGGLTTLSNLLATGSSTLQNFTASNSTTTNATTTTLFATTASTTNLFATNFTVANLTTGLVNGQTISSAANFTGTLTATGGLTTLSNLLATGSSTLQNFTASNGTTTNATTTTLFASVASSTNLFATNITSGLINGQQISSTANLTGVLTVAGLTTLTNGSLALASTTLQNFTGVNATTTNATTTTLAITGVSNALLKTLPSGAVVAAVLNTDYINSSVTTLSSLTSIGTLGTLNVSGLATLGNILATGSSTFQNFTGSNSTTTNATTTTLFAATASSTNLFATNITSGLINGQQISSTANFTGTVTATGGLTTLSNLLVTGSSTFQNFTAVNGTTTNATSTNIFATTAQFGTVCLIGDSCRTTWPSGSGVAVDWNKQTNYGVLTLTPTSTIPVWVKDQLFASSSATIAGLVTANNFIATGTVASIFPYASTTALTASGFIYGGNFVATGSSTLQAFTATNSTTTNATSTTLFASVASTTNLFATNITSGLINGQQISSTANFTGTLTALGGLTSLSNLLVTGSSTLQNFTASNSTTTNATTTTLFASVASTTNLFATNLTAATITSGLINGQTISSAANFTGTLTATGGLTTLSNLLATGSSTLQNFTGVNSTTTNATSTTLFAATASSTNLFATNITSGLINGQQISSTANFTGTLTATGGLVTILNELHTGSTTLQAFTATNSTTTNATTTTLFATTASTTNLFATNFTVANLTSGLINGQTISSAANFTGTLTATGGLTTLSNLLATGSSTLQNFTASNGTTTNATSTTLFASVASTTNLFATAITSGLINGQQISSTANLTGTLTVGGLTTFTSGFLSMASSTLQAFTGTNATTTNATSTTIFATVASTTNLFASVVTAGLFNGQQISSSANFTGTLNIGGLTTINNGFLALASSTLQNFTATNGTTTNATTTTLFATTASTTNLFATTGQFGAISTGKISNLTPNGFVKTSNGDGTLSVDTNSYLLANSTDFVKQTNYNTLSLTASTTIPLWIKDQLFASSSAIFAGSVTANNFVATGTVASVFPYASTTAISSTGNAYFATSGNGRIGLGTTTPGNLNPNGFTFNANTTGIDIQSTVNSYTFLALRNSVNSAGLTLFNDFATGENYIDSTFNSNTRAAFRFRTKTSGTASEALTIFGDRTVGVGSTSPYAVLSVKGLTGTTEGSKSFVVSNVNNVENFSVADTGTTTVRTNLAVGGSLRIGTDAQSFWGFEGDSLSSQGQYYALELASSSPMIKFMNITNLATSGASTTDMVNEIPTQIAPYCTGSGNVGDSKTISIWMGVNDIINGFLGGNAGAVYANLKTGWNAARSYGCKVMAMTIMKYDGMSPTQAQERVDINNLILSDPSQYDYLARPDLVLDPTKDRSFFQDTTHPNAAGGSLVGEVVNQTLTARPFILAANAPTTTSPYTFDMWLNPTGRVSIGTTTDYQNAQLTVFGTSTRPLLQVTTAASSSALFINSSGLTTLSNLLLTGSSTLQNLTALNSTTTNATSTQLFATTAQFGTICLTGDTCRTTWPTGGAGGGSGTWSTTTSQVANQFVNYSNNTTDLIAIGGLSTTSAKYWFDPNAQIASLAGNVGIGTSSPYAALSVVGSTGVVANLYTATGTSASTFPYASTTVLSSIANAYFGTNGTGKVGVGTTTLSDVLTLENTGNSFLRVTNNGNGNASGIFFTTQDSIATNRGKAYIRVNSDTSSVSSQLDFGVGVNIAETSSSGVMTLTSGGLIGLGTTTNLATSKLTVAGANVAPTGVGMAQYITTDAEAADVGASINLGGRYRTTDATSFSFGYIAGRKTNGTTNDTKGYLQFGYSGGTGLVEGMRLNELGNFGIGTTSPFGSLAVSNTRNTAANTPLFTLASTTDGTATSTLFIVQSNGLVGIGTTSPYAALSVAGSSGVVANIFTATGTIASTFQYASTTALTASGFIYGGNLFTTGSSTLQNFTASNGTTTNATSTSLFAATASSTNLFATAITAGLFNGQQISSTANFTGTLTATGGLVTILNELHTGSTTLQNFTGVNATTTNATSTTFFASVASSTNLFATTLTSGLINGQQISSTANFTGTVTATGGLVTILNELHTGSTTLQNFTGVNATTTNATTTTFFASVASSTNLFATNFTVANLTTGLVNGQTISSAANFTGTLTATGGLTTLSNLLVTGSTTLQNFTAVNATSTNATSTTLFASVASSTNLFATAITAGLFNGQQISSTANFTGTLTATGGLVTIANLLHTGSTTLQNFTATNGTTTNATSTTLFATTAQVGTLCLTADSCRTSWPSSGGGAFPFLTTTNYGISVNSTTTPIWLRDQLFASSSAIFAGTVTANNFVATGTVASVFPYASTTAITAGTICIVGDVCRTSWPSSGGGAFPFLTTTNYGISVNSTTTPIWFRDQIFASSSATIAGNVTASGFIGTSTTATSTIAGYFGIGTTSPFAPLSVQKTNASTIISVVGNVANFMQMNMQNQNSSSGVSTDYVATADNGSETTHYIDMGINGSGGGSAPFTTANDAYIYSSDDSLNLGALGASSEMRFFTTGGNSAVQRMVLSASGFLGIGTTSPYAALSVVGATGIVADKIFASSTTATSTFAGGLDVGSGALAYDFSSGKTSVDNISVGSFSFDTNAGVVSWADMPVDSNAPAGTAESYIASIDSVPLLTLRGEANGSGGLRSMGVSIGSTTPYAKLSVWGNGTGNGQTFAVVNSASSTLFTVLDNGTVGAGTTTPWATFAINPIAGVASNQFVVGSSTATSFLINNSGNVGVGTTSPASLFSVAGSSFFGSGTASTMTINSGVVNYPITSTTTIVNGKDNAWSIATSSTNRPIFSVSTRSSPEGLVGIATSSPWGKLSVEFGTLSPGFVVSNQGSSTPSFIIAGVNQNGAVGIATSSPSQMYQLSVSGSTYLGAGTGSTLTIHSPTINYVAAATTTLAAVKDALTFATSTTALNPVFGISNSSTGATTTIGFFVSTTTALTAGQGLGLAATMKELLIIGNGKQQAGVVITNGGLCVDSDGWCTPSTTGQISGKTVATGGSDLAEVYNATEPLEPGDIVSTLGGVNVAKSTIANIGNNMGVITTAPGLILGNSPDEDMRTPERAPIALTGRVPVKVSLEGGPIAVGDFITISSVSGVGMRANPASSTRVVAMALEAFNSDTPGKILAFIDRTTTLGDGSKLAELDLKTTTSIDVLNNLSKGLTALETKLASTTDALAARIDKLEAAAALAASSTPSTASSTPTSLFAGGLIVSKLGSATSTMDILGDINFIGRPYFNNDTAGSAIIKTGGRRVEVVFDKDYLDAPVVNATIALDDASTTDMIDETILSNDIRYIITKKTVHGFQILMNKTAPYDITFSWTAFAVKNGKLFTSKDGGVTVIQTQPTQTQTTPTTPTTPTTQTTTTGSTTPTTTTSTSPTSTTTSPVAPAPTTPDTTGSSTPSSDTSGQISGTVTTPPANTTTTTTPPPATDTTSTTASTNNNTTSGDTAPSTGQ